MAIHLLDVNVLLALSWPTHQHHDSAFRWFRANAHLGWATCPITEAGFVRISSNARITQFAVSVPDAMAAFEVLTRHPQHIFWPDSIPVAKAMLRTAITGHHQITDAYLAALAAERGGVLATFDGALPVLDPAVHLIRP